MFLRHAPAAAFSLIFTAGCAATTAPVAAPVPLADPAHISSSRPPAPGVDAARSARIEAALPDIGRIFRDAAHRHGLPNAVIGVVVADSLRFAEGFGARTDEGRPVAADTVFRIRSITKIFTVMALLALHDGAASASTIR